MRFNLYTGNWAAAITDQKKKRYPCFVIYNLQKTSVLHLHCNNGLCVRSGCLVGLGTLPLQLQKGTEQAQEGIEEIIRILSLYFTVIFFLG
jgi:hypothetical protein